MIISGPVEGLLDRSPPKPDVAQVLNKIHAPLVRAVDLGTHVLSWSFEQENMPASRIVGAMMLRKSIETLDAISALVLHGIADPLSVLARDVFEVSLYIDYLLHGDTEHRAAAYMYSRLLSDLHIAKQIVHEQAKPNGPVSVAPDILSMCKTEIPVITARLMAPQYDQYRQEFDSPIAKSPGSNRKKWYSYGGGPQTIRDLAQQLNRLQEYLYIYSKLSKQAHTEDVVRRLAAGEGGRAVVHGLRNPHGSEFYSQISVDYFLTTLRIYVTTQFPERWPDVMGWFGKQMNQPLSLLRNLLIVEDRPGTTA